MAALNGCSAEQRKRWRKMPLFVSPMDVGQTVNKVYRKYISRQSRVTL